MIACLGHSVFKKTKGLVQNNILESEASNLSPNPGLILVKLKGADGVSVSVTVVDIFANLLDFRFYSLRLLLIVGWWPW
jgi:hypothetical protein